MERSKLQRANELETKIKVLESTRYELNNVITNSNQLCLKLRNNYIHSFVTLGFSIEFCEEIKNQMMAEIELQLDSLKKEFEAL